MEEHLIDKTIIKLPNKSSCGVVIKFNENSKFIIGVYIGDVSNNVAEYYGAIYGLYITKLLDIKWVLLRGDS